MALRWAEVDIGAGQLLVLFCCGVRGVIKVNVILTKGKGCSKWEPIPEKLSVNVLRSDHSSVSNHPPRSSQSWKKKKKNEKLCSAKDTVT